MATFESLRQKWNSLGDSLEEKNKFIRDSQDEFGKLSVSITNVDEATSIFNSNTGDFLEALDARAKAAAAMDLAAEEYKKAINKMMEAENAQINLWDNAKSIFITGGLAGTGSFDTNLLEEITPEKMMEDRKKNIEEAAKNAFEESKKLVSKYIQYTEEEQNILESLGIKSTDKIVEGSVAAIEASIALKRKALKDLTNPKDYKKAKDEIEKLEKQLEAITGGKNANINYNKLQQDVSNASKALEDAVLKSERDIEQASINLMEEGGEKQLAQLKLNFKKRMDEVKAQTDTYVKLVREQELKEWKQKNPTKKESEFTSKTTDSNTLPQEYQSLIVQQAKLADKEYESNTQKLINNLLKQWGDYGDKRAAIERETESKIEQINSVRNLIGDDVANKAIATVKKQAKEQVDALESESLKLTSFYQKLFGDISSYGNGALDFLIEKTKEVISKLQAPDISSQLKESGKAVIEIDGKDVDITEGDVARLIKRLGELEKTASTRNPFKRLAEGVNEYKKASDKVAKEKALKKSFEAAAEIANGLSQSLSTLQDTLGTIGVNSPELDAVFGGLEKTLNGLSSIDITKPFSIITGGLTAVGGLFQTIFNPRQARLQKVIESSQREVKRLQNAFEDLDRAVDNALGGEVYSISKKQLGNLRKQQAELSKQIQAERDKKKTDQNFIDDAYRQIEELNQQIVDIVENIRESILGGTVQEIANQLGDAFFEAFAQGEDAAEAWGDKVDEIVQGIIRRMLIQKLIEEPVGRILEKYTSKWLDNQGNFLGYDQVMQSALDLGIELKNFGTGLSSIIDTLPDDIKNILQTGDEKKQSGLTGEVKNITEDQADIIGSYLNAVRADVSVKRRLLENIAGNILPTISITAQAQLQQLNAIADNTLANASAAKAIQNALDSVITVGNGGRAIRIK